MFKTLYSLGVVLEEKRRSLVVVQWGKGSGLVGVLRGNRRVSSNFLNNYDQFGFCLFSTIRKAKLVIALEGNGRHSFLSSQNYDLTSSLPA